MSANGNKIADGKVVLIHFTITNEDGEVVDSTEEDGPMPYLHGADNIVPGLEAALTGLTSGARFDVTVPPEDAFGVHDGTEPMMVPRSNFPDDMELEEGMPLTAETDDEEEFQVWVISVDDDVVTVDLNHPMCDQTLHFVGEVVAVRDATPDEVAHGHAHGLDGFDLSDH